jgi:hypothetical protein
MQNGIPAKIEKDIVLQKNTSSFDVSDLGIVPMVNEWGKTGLGSSRYENSPPRDLVK